MVITFVVIFFLVVLWLILILNKKPKSIIAFDEEHFEILHNHVSYFQLLDLQQQQVFVEMMKKFLTKIRITGVKTSVEKIDRVFVAASAIIPIFALDNWEYTNLNEVLLYPETFNGRFKQWGEDRTYAGMVGTGPMQNVMILSQNYLRHGFLSPGDFSNTGIHEFVHLVDKTDGDTDGVPESLVDKTFVQQWIQLMHHHIHEIKEGRSGINSYAGTNRAEFFAVVSEIFFKQPVWLQENYTELYNSLQKIFRQHPAMSSPLLKH